MKPVFVALWLAAFVLPVTGQQSGKDSVVSTPPRTIHDGEAAPCTTSIGFRKVNIPAGAITNGESISLTEKAAWKGASSGIDPALRAFAQLDDDTRNAASFYRRVSNTPPVQEDEALQIIDEEVLYGEALACRGENCHLVFIRPVSQIAHHWLASIQRHYEELQELGTKTPEGSSFISEMKKADEQSNSVWTKLKTLYCQMEPDGRYTDLNGSIVLCRNASH